MNDNNCEKNGVLLINMGGPGSLDGIEDYLYSLLSDPLLIRMPLPLFAQRIWARRIARIRSVKVRPRYEAIGGSSPLLTHTLAQAAALQDTLALPVEVGMSYSAPFIPDALKALQDKGVANVVVLPLYPQYSGSTTGSALAEAEKCASQMGLRLHSIRSHQVNTGFIKALSDMLLAHLPKSSLQNVHVLFVAHSLPEKYIRQGDPYQSQLLETTQAVSATLPHGLAFSNAYSSRMGPMRWLGPTVEEEIARLAESGVKTLVVQTLSFVSEHLETLFDLDIEAAAIARECGINEFIRVPTVSAHKEYINGLADEVRAILNAGGN